MKRKYIRLTAHWGNDDVESTIKVSPKRWQHICEGANYETTTWSYYEGTRSRVKWSFSAGFISIGGGDGAEYLVEEPVDGLYVEELRG